MSKVILCDKHIRVQYGMSKFLYYTCLCWLFGHKWKEVGTFFSHTLYEEEKEQFPKGYHCRKCVLCDLVVKEELILIE